MVTLKNVFTFVGFLVVLILVYFVFFRTPSKPWEESGHFVLAVRTVPGASNDTLLHIGLDNFELYKKDGGTEKVSALTRRIALNPEDKSLSIVLDTYVPVGEYSGFAFILKSPELRNAWEENEAPHIVSLLQENIRLDIPYFIVKDVTSSVILSFETNNVIHVIENENVLLPVIQLETRGNTHITGGELEPIAIVGGDILHSVTFGMDWDGRMRRNFRAKIKETKLESLLDESSTHATTSTEIFENASSTNETSTSTLFDADTQETSTSTLSQ